MKIGIAVVVAFVAIGAIGSIGGGSDAPTKASLADTTVTTKAPTTSPTTDTPTSTPKPKPKPKPKPAFGKQPAQELAVVKLIQKARKAYDGASNDLQKGAALSTRDKKICAVLGGGRVSNWTGKIYTLDSNGDGNGVLGINIEPNSQVETWNNVVSDAGDNTLIKPGALLTRIAGMKKGQVVTFSGQFVAELGGGSCFSDPRFTKSGKVDKPLFIFRFSDVRR